MSVQQPYALQPPRLDQATRRSSTPTATPHPLRNSRGQRKTHRDNGLARQVRRRTQHGHLLRGDVGRRRRRRVPGWGRLSCVVTGNGASGASASWGGHGIDLVRRPPSPTSPTSTRSPALGQPRRPASGSATARAAASSSPPSSDLGTVTPDTSLFRPGVTDITQVTCPSANGCYALGTTATGPVLLAGAVGQTAPQHGHLDRRGPPASTTFTSLSSIACPTSSTCRADRIGCRSGSSPSAPDILRLDGDPATLATNAGVDTDLHHGHPADLGNVHGHLSRGDQPAPPRPSAWPPPPVTRPAPPIRPS